MTDLTEKWKAGELEEGAYYILLATDEIYPDSYNQYGYFEQFDNLVEKVLAPVPSYEELQSLEADRMAKNEGAEIVSELKQENARLKDLLKWCLPIVSAEVMTWQIRGGEESHQRGKELLTKIEEALK